MTLNSPQRIPSLHNLLAAGDQGRIKIEVQTHLDSEMVRGIAMTPTQGLARGSTVIDTGQSIQVPVGQRLLGRMFNALGETIDGRW